MTEPKTGVNITGDFEKPLVLRLVLGDRAGEDQVRKRLVSRMPGLGIAGGRASGTNRGQGNSSGRPE